MKSILLAVGLASVASIANAQYYGYSNRRAPQHYDYKDQYGMPSGSADYQQWNNSWQFKDQYGMPSGSAEYQRWNHSWELKDQYGMPRGSVQP